MTARRWLRRVWLLSRPMCMALLSLLVVIGSPVVVSVAGIHIVGSVDRWESWLRAHATHFFVWRLLLYAATAYGWCWMRGRLRRREPSGQAHQRLLRVEIAAVTTIVLLEGSQLLRHA